MSNTYLVFTDKKLRIRKHLGANILVFNSEMKMEDLDGKLTRLVGAVFDPNFSLANLPKDMDKAFAEGLGEALIVPMKLKSANNATFFYKQAEGAQTSLTVKSNKETTHQLESLYYVTTDVNTLYNSLFWLDKFDEELSAKENLCLHYDFVKDNNGEFISCKILKGTCDDLLKKLIKLKEVNNDNDYVELYELKQELTMKEVEYAMDPLARAMMGFLTRREEYMNEVDKRELSDISKISTDPLA